MPQWSSAAEEDHHPVTSEFFSDASPPKPLMLGLPKGASELPALPSRGGQAQRHTQDGSVAEGLHAMA